MSLPSDLLPDRPKGWVLFGQENTARGFSQLLVTGNGGCPVPLPAGCNFVSLRFLIPYGRFASLYPDAHGGNSSIATAPSCWPSRIRVNSCGFPQDIVPRHDFPCHPSCDNPCAVYRRPGVDRLLELQGWP